MLLAGPARISSNRLRCGSDQLAQARTAADMGWRHQCLSALALDSAKPMPRRGPVLPQRYPSFFQSCPHRFPSGFPPGTQGSAGLPQDAFEHLGGELLLGTGELFESFGKF